MYYVYLIRSKNIGQYYIGQTNDLRRRLSEHNSGESKWTSKTNDWELIYYEAFTSRKMAVKREYKLKHNSRGKQELLKRVIEESGEG